MNPRTEALRAFQRVADKANVPYVLIGAAAKAALLAQLGEMNSRQTLDWDVGLLLESWSDLGQLSEALRRAGFRRESQQRFHHGKTPLDLIPFGPIESSPGTVTWENEGVDLDVRGLKEVFEKSEPVRVEGMTVRSATLPGLILLKIRAYMERRQLADDLQDILEILDAYEVTEDTYTLFREEMIEETLNDLVLPAAQLGFDVASQFPADLLEPFLTAVSQGELELQDDLARAAPRIDFDYLDSLVAFGIGVAKAQ